MMKNIPINLSTIYYEKVKTLYRQQRPALNYCGRLRHKDQ